MGKIDKNLLHEVRYKEIELIEDLFVNSEQKNLLELGCGDGYQSQLLHKYFKSIISTDLNESRMNFDLKNLGIKLEVLDAECVGERFNKESFDFIFSSNLLEHLPNYNKCLNGISKVLKKDGLIIIILPNTLWRLSGIIFHYPYKFKNLFNKLLGRRNKSNSLLGNNIKSKRKSNKYLNLIFPKAHGAYKNSIIELYEFSIFKWKKVFINNGFEIIEVRKGPLSSGYRFGFKKIKYFISKLGFTTEYIYVLRKA